MILRKLTPAISKFCCIGTCILILSACNPTDSSSQNNADNEPPSTDQNLFGNYPGQMNLSMRAFRIPQNGATKTDISETMSYSFTPKGEVKMHV